MIFFTILIACSLLINDAAQLESYKPDYDNLDCEIMCKCPQGPPGSGQGNVIFDGGMLSKSKPKNTNIGFLKRIDEAPSQELEKLYVEYLAETGKWTEN
ncbi:uncharacterized protein LOC126770472 isoform X2 [Nymphalis io]|uniref:uncharacterized protein LOC126770472 isoform X2 n=1 Tax=Inachis io TaxID=171585 RepID=UPI00216968DD|nr:uncharacterized protein LOC126770472 isoform X2 [Nymphalis io]